MQPKSVSLPMPALLGLRCKQLLKWPVRKVGDGWRRGRVAGARTMARAGWFPVLRKSWLASAIDWERIGLEPGDVAGLTDHVAATKFETVGYWISRVDSEWYRRDDPFGTHADAVAEADRILSGSISLAGREPLPLGPEVAWSRDPLTGAPIWPSRVSLRPRRDVDTRFWVELNLHRHFLPVARAGFITGEPRFGAYIAAQWRDWLRSNPPIDEEYVSDGLELALRVIGWTHVLFLLGEQGFGRQQVLQLLALVARYGAMIEAQCDGNRNRNNHLAAEAFGLYFIGAMYPELKPSRRWRDKGLRILGQVAQEQFSDDGVHVEQALGYQFFVAEILAAAQHLAQRAGHAAPEQIGQRLDACAVYLDALTRCDGSTARYGDEGMVLFSPTGITGVHAGRIRCLLASLLGRQAPASLDRWREEAFWWTGRRQLDAVAAAALPAAPSCHVYDGGHVVLTAGDAHVHFDCSRHGLGKRAGHGHDDALSFAYHRGTAWIEDVGTYTYVRQGPYREYFAGALGHNGVLFNGRGAGRMVPNGSFGWLQKANAEVLAHGHERDWVWAAGRHVGADGTVQHWFPRVDRYMVLARDGVLLLVDVCDPERAGDLDGLLHLAPGVEPEAQPDWVLLRKGEARLQLLVASSASQTISMHHGDDEATPGWHSHAYGHVAAAWVLRLRARAQGSFWRATALVPDSMQAALEVEELGDGQLQCNLYRPGSSMTWVIDRKTVRVGAGASA